MYSPCIRQVFLILICLYKYVLNFYAIQSMIVYPVVCSYKYLTNSLLQHLLSFFLSLICTKRYKKSVKPILICQYAFCVSLFCFEDRFLILYAWFVFLLFEAAVIEKDCILLELYQNCRTGSSQHKRTRKTSVWHIQFNWKPDRIMSVIVLFYE